MPEAVRSRPLTADARVRAQFSQSGICGGRSGTGAGFSQRSLVSSRHYHSIVVLHTHLYHMGMNNGLVSGRSWETPSHPVDMNNKVTHVWTKFQRRRIRNTQSQWNNYDNVHLGTEFTFQFLQFFFIIYLSNISLYLSLHVCKQRADNKFIMK
jgi:hypothetical protein